MENGLRMNTPTGALDFDEPEPWFDTSRRSFLRAAGLLAAGMMVPQARADETPRPAAGSG